MRFRVDLRIDVVGLFPIGIGRVEGFEIGDEVGAVEDAVAEVACERCQPGAAQQAADIAHRIAAAHAGPVAERRSGEQDGPDDVGFDGGHHHDLPAGLAVGDDDGFAFRLGMARRHLLDERRLGGAHVLDGLPRHRLRQETDEIAGMAGGKGDADLALLLHAADAGAVARPRIDHDERRLGGIDHRALGRDDVDQSIVDRSRQRAAIAHHIEPEAEHVRRRALGAIEIGVAPLVQDIERQDRALPGVEPVFLHEVQARSGCHKHLHRMCVCLAGEGCAGLDPAQRIRGVRSECDLPGV